MGTWSYVVCVCVCNVILLITCDVIARHMNCILIINSYYKTDYSYYGNNLSNMSSSLSFQIFTAITFQLKLTAVMSVILKTLLSCNCCFDIAFWEVRFFSVVCSNCVNETVQSSGLSVHTFQFFSWISQLRQFSCLLYRIKGGSK